MSSTTAARINETAREAATASRAAPGRTPPRGARPGRAGRDHPRPSGTGRTTPSRGYAGFVDGANALRLDVLDPARIAQRSVSARTVADRVADPTARRAFVPRQRGRGAVVAEPAAAPAPVALPRAPFVVLIVALVVAGVVGVLVLNTKINENAFELDNLRAQQHALDLQEEQLRQQLADQESTGNLAAEAARLGLVPAGDAGFLTLPDGKVVGSAKPADASGSGR